MRRGNGQCHLKWVVVYSLLILIHWYLVSQSGQVELVGLGTKLSIVRETMPGSTEGRNTFSLMISNLWAKESTKGVSGGTAFLNLWKEYAKDYMIVSIEPILHPALHHMMLYSYYEIDRIQCHEANGTDANLTYSHKRVAAEQTLMSWAHGGSKLVLPEYVGIRMDMTGFKLQYHLAYNEKHDEFGWKITFEPRPSFWFNAYVVHLGLYKMTIPANTESTTLRSFVKNCPRNYIIFAVMVHAHDWARWGSLNITRKGVSVFYYSHEVGMRNGVPLPQLYRNLPDPFLVEPGDKCEVACNYNTVGLDRELHYGQTTEDEMCRLNVYGYENTKLA